MYFIISFKIPENVLSERRTDFCVRIDTYDMIRRAYTALMIFVDCLWHSLIFEDDTFECYCSNQIISQAKQQKTLSKSGLARQDSK